MGKRSGPSRARPSQNHAHVIALTPGKGLYTLIGREVSVTVSSRCSACLGHLTVQPRTLCEDHKQQRAKELARARARRYRARKNPGRTPADPNATALTLTPSETQQLASLTIDLLDKENAMRAWAARHDRNQLPQIVREYFATAVRIRKALSGLTHHDPY